MNKITKIITVYCLLLCMAGRAQDILLTADSCEKIDMGFYSYPKESITGAVTTIEGQSLMKPVSNTVLSLVGKSTGVFTIMTESELTRAGMYMNIRGHSTINSSTPIFIVDGIISPISLVNYMNPEEIESISFLKDVSSLAVYGIQGANGAIVVTTKKGDGSEPLKVNAWYYHSLQQMTKQPHFVSSDEYARLRNEAGANSGLGAYSQFTQEQTDKFASGTDLLYPNNNWYDMFVRKVRSMQQVGISVQGWKDRIKHFSAINYLHQSSPFIVANEVGRKYDPTPRADIASIRSNFDVKFNSYLSAFLLMNGLIRVDKYASGVADSEIYYRSIITPPVMYGPLTPVETISSDGEISSQSNQVTTYNGDDYPLYGLLNRGGYSRVQNSWIYTQAGVTLDLGFLTEGLSLTGLLAYQMYGSNGTTTLQNFERYVRSANYSELEFSKYKTFENTPLTYSRNSLFSYSQSLSVRGHYGRTFGDHAIQSSVFYYYNKQEKENWAALGFLPYMNETAGLTAIYGYRNKYFVKADIGYSGSEQFHPDYRFMATPAISAAWILSKEYFMAGMEWLSMLKLRVSYGINANDQLGSDRFMYADNNRAGVEGARGNPQLSAEKIRKQNYGIDLGLFGSVSLSVDWFYHQCDNMLVRSGLIPVYQTVPLEYYPKLNNGKMENQGIEIEVGYNEQWSRDLSVFAIAGFSFARNKVIKVNELPYSDHFYPLRSEGFRLGQQWGYLINYSNGNGMFNSQQELDASGLTYSSMVTPRVGDFIYQDLNKDGVIDEGDLAPIGYPLIPEIIYSFTSGMQWKNFDVSFLLQGVANNSVTISGTGAYENASLGVFNDFHLNAWTPERYAAGEKIDYPALSLTTSANHVANNFFVMDRSYLKLRNVEIGYSLPVSIAKKIKTENIRFLLSGQNLFTIDRMRTRYIDPEIGTMANFQPYRVYSVGIKCTF
jgi:TonB-linked SusC/RagA family outer membrane protein